MCSHTPTCPSPSAPDADAAQPVTTHFEQGWTLLCNGVLLFEDSGQLHPDLTVIPPHRLHSPDTGREAA